MNLNLNPSDADLWQVIIEKDAEIERLKSGKEILSASHKYIEEKWIKESEMQKAEIARLNQLIQSMQAIEDWQSRKLNGKPYTVAELLETLHKGPGKISAITFSVDEWEKVLLCMKRLEAEKNAAIDRAKESRPSA